MHHIVRADEVELRPPPFYQQHSRGYSRFAMVDHRVEGAVHSGTGLGQLEPGGLISTHVHSYEEGFYIMEGQALVSLDERAYRLGPGDYGVIQVGVPHAWRNVGPHPVCWLEMLSPQPRPESHPEQDTFFLTARHAPGEAAPPDFQDPLTRYLGHFDDSQLPPPSELQMDGYRGGRVQGISLRMMVDRLLGAQHLTMFMVEFQPGGAGHMHDHPFEETYFFLSGGAEAELDGQRYQINTGDFVWTSVGGTHGYFNTGDVPVRWLETQAPQPPDQQAFRFNSHWQYLANKLIQDD